MWLELGCVLVVIVFYIYRKQQYWQSRGVKTRPYHFLIGHMYDLIGKKHPWIYIHECYKDLKDEPYWGMYELTVPRLFVKDPEILRDILVKEFDNFVDRRYFPFNQDTSELDIMFSQMLFHSRGDKWKHLRALLTPTFTSGKIKSMYPLIETKADELVQHLQGKLGVEENIEIRQPVGKFSLAVIATCAFGLELSITNERTKFDESVDALGKFDALLISKIILMSVLPKKVVASTCLTLTPKEMNNFEEILRETCAIRKKRNIRRDDFLDLLNDCLEKSMNSADCNVKMTFQSLVAQSILFLVAGYDTTANTLGFVFFLLAKHPECQAILREELQTILDEDGKFNYHNLMEAKYMDAVLAETLRIFPQIHLLERRCTQKYRIPKTGLVIEEGVLVEIPVYSLHHDEEIWENPSQFKPERFLEENKHKIPHFVYMPFGAGPRNCIGMRFAQLVMKIITAKIILNFEMSLTEENQEVRINSDIFNLKATDHGVHIKLKPLNRSN